MSHLWNPSDRAYNPFAKPRQTPSSTKTTSVETPVENSKQPVDPVQPQTDLENIKINKVSEWSISLSPIYRVTENDIAGKVFVWNNQSQEIVSIRSVDIQGFIEYQVQIAYLLHNLPKALNRTSAGVRKKWHQVAQDTSLPLPVFNKRGNITWDLRPTPGLPDIMGWSFVPVVNGGAEGDIPLNGASARGVIDILLRLQHSFTSTFTIQGQRPAKVSSKWPRGSLTRIWLEAVTEPFLAENSKSALARWIDIYQV